ncbi:MAG: hypothetical protein P8Y66_05345 [Nitrospirota bacterium]|jgi:response regulator RpfG family c-di-GMP phosphodiesterase
MVKRATSDERLACRVLIIGEEILRLNILKESLNGAGYEVYVTDSVVRAKSLSEFLNFHALVVVLGKNVLNMEAALRLIRGIKSLHPEIRTILAGAEDACRQRGTVQDVDVCLSFPWRLSELRNALECRNGRAEDG